MIPFEVKQGELINGIGFNFVNRLVTGETILSSVVTTGNGLTVTGTSNSGADAIASIQVGNDIPDQETFIDFTVTGSAGSVRKARRVVIIKALSE
jgi:hypothetical protein